MRPRALVVLVGSLLVAPSLGAQRIASAPRATPVFRADAVTESRAGTVQIGAGVVVPAGYLVRIALEGGVGATVRDADWRPSGRLDATARVLVDPFREARWGVALGGGAGMRWERGEGPRPVALVVVALQGPAGGRRWVRGVEAVVGGGLRLGVTVARPAPGRR
ncbi:MAG: hypothetical protein MUF40_03915 [Gemmatimonadaceae bacterium]|nr:hypothetical protein [Gemmatimonadaceae bacterium]